MENKNIEDALINFKRGHISLEDAMHIIIEEWQKKQKQQPDK